MTHHLASRTWGLLAFALVVGTSAQAQTAAAPQGIAGYINPATGVFTAVPRTAQALPPEQLPLASTTSTGVIKFVYAITLKSGIPAGNSIQCSANLYVSDDDFTSSVSYTETKAVEAVRTGTTAACTVAIPYSWLLPDVAGTKVSLNYSVTTYDTSTTAGAAFLTRRSHNGTLNPITVPANGATITKSIKVTL